MDAMSFLKERLVERVDCSTFFVFVLFLWREGGEVGVERKKVF